MMFSRSISSSHLDPRDDVLAVHFILKHVDHELERVPIQDARGGRGSLDHPGDRYGSTKERGVSYLAHKNIAKSIISKASIRSTFFARFMSSIAWVGQVRMKGRFRGRAGRPHTLSGGAS